MSSNRGRTTLKCKQARSNPMREFDRLPAELRIWVAHADLPWRSQSVKRAYDKALKRTGDPNLALAELDRLQHQSVSRDAAKIWGAEHPAAHLSG